MRDPSDFRHSTGEVRWKRYVATGLFDNDKKLKDYSEEEWDTLLYKTGFKPPNPTKEWPPPRITKALSRESSGPF